MFNASPQQKQLAFNALGQLAANVVQPQITPKGIDTSYSGVGLGNINLGIASGIGNYGTGYIGSAIPDPYSQLQGFDYVDNQYAATKPMYQDMYATQRQNRLLDYQTMQDAIKPNLTWAAMQAPAQQQRAFGASNAALCVSKWVSVTSAKGSTPPHPDFFIPFMYSFCCLICASNSFFS